MSNLEEEKFKRKTEQDIKNYELIKTVFTKIHDIEKEINNSEDNIELDSYSEELRSGMYRDMEKIYNSFPSRGINKEDI